MRSEDRAVLLFCGILLLLNAMMNFYTLVVNALKLPEWCWFTLSLAELVATLLVVCKAYGGV